MKNLFAFKQLISLCSLFLISVLSSNSQALAQLCWPDQCPAGSQMVIEKHQEYMEDIIHKNDSVAEGDSFDDQLIQFQDWLVPAVPPGPLIEPAGREGFWRGHPIRALRLMTRQLSSFAMNQALIIGTFIDAKQQMDTHRTFQILKAEAHRDYTPSEDFCWFGTNVRGMAASESRGRFNALALNKWSLDRQLAKRGTTAAKTIEEDFISRWQKFTTTYCNPQDNNWNYIEKSGLENACGPAGGGETERINIDIDYPRLIDQRRTLDVSFDNTASATEDREDVMAMSKNLFGHDALSRSFEKTDFTDQNSREKMRRLYLAVRSIAARRNVAENSFNALIEMKSAGGIEEGDSSSAREFLAAILTEIGIPTDEIFDYIGENPSYYAQLEILAKKLYQNPEFFINLYDKPANVERKAVALKAIELMLDRAIYESHLRREMATSVLLSTKLHSSYSNLNNQVVAAGGAE